MHHKQVEGAALYATADLGNLRPTSEVAASVEASLDEIAARSSGTSTGLAVSALDETKIWANYRKNKGTPLSAHRRPN